MHASWDLTAEEVKTLPLDDLALRVLKDARDTNEWNWQNWLLAARHHHYQSDRQALQALSEAWGWLLNRGLIAWDAMQSHWAAVFVSRQGHLALERGLPWIRAVERLNVQMVPALEGLARPQFLRGDFEAAAFMAMKEVEVRVRTLAGLPNSLVGVPLMQEAFRPAKNPSSTPGPLWRAESDGGEAVALMELFKGAIGLFKNPSSHRRVDFEDATEAAEVVLLADLLLRLLDRLEGGSASDASLAAP